MSCSRNSVYFITDAHLGAGADSRQRERELCELLDRVGEEAAMVVFLGDMFDFWFSYKYVVPRGHVRLLGSMARLADAGVELHFFVGNHDMWLFDYLEREIGCIMHNDPEVLTFDGRRFLVGHGDGLGHMDRRYDMLRHLFRSRTCQRLLALLPTRLTFAVANRWSDSSRESHIKKNPRNFEYAGDDNEGIVRYIRKRMEAEQFDYCLFGHRHTPVRREIRVGDNVTEYINVGDWLRGRTYAKYEQGRLALLGDD